MSKDLINGSILHCLETATLGMPLEVWKTRMCIYRNENTVKSFINIYNKGLGQFYAGFYAKLVESGSKGAVLLLSKEKIIKVCNDLNINKTTSGFIGGACGGICQSLVMSPCTFFITASIDKKINYKEKLFYIFKNTGITTLYKGNTAMCLRQGTNWASRQGITEFIRNVFIQCKDKTAKRNNSNNENNNDANNISNSVNISYNNSNNNNNKNDNNKYNNNYNNGEHNNYDKNKCNNKNAIINKSGHINKVQTEMDASKVHLMNKNKNSYSDLNTSEEIICGVLGGALSVWNNPFDVVRVYMQNNANNNIKLTFSQSLINIYKEGGVLYLYKGVIPRCFLCIWQTLFMVTGVKILNKYF
ncbi:mitochondrial carrier protein, putative [Plasmodium malariae]|uniref:Mitochondrial carrier protein, putative n=1 Tax=Plasmodium malariae TaxID=5858 RepID=A0A1C3L2Z7_PLAMA|nr:mitochondrial carrier protein, putative [Plasmodium malariae]